MPIVITASTTHFMLRSACLASLAKGDAAWHRYARNCRRWSTRLRLRIPCADTRKFAVIDEVKARLAKSGANVSDIDGVRVGTPDGWWLLRASNTQAVLVARAEASDRNGLDRLLEQLRAQLKMSGIALPRQH